MEEFWRQSVNPALRVRRVNGVLHCEANAAAQTWAESLGVPPVELPLRWQALAPRVLAAAEAGLVQRWDLGAGWGQAGPWFNGQAIASADGSLLWWCETQPQASDERGGLRHSLELAGIGVFRRSNWTGPRDEAMISWGDRAPTYWSPQMYLLRGLQPDDPRSPDTLVFSTMHPDDWGHSIEVPSVEAAAERPVTRHYRVVWPDGTLRWILAIARPVRDQRGRFLHRVGINVDVTLHRQTEALAAEAERLAHLRRTQGEFLARVSHELRTPLNTVLGLAQLMRSDASAPLAPQQAHHLQMMEGAGRQLLALIEDVLDMASLHSGAPRVLRESVGLEGLVEQALRKLGPTAQEAGVSLRQARVAAGCAVLGDHGRLGQVLAQLLSNAIKFNRTGGWVEVASASRQGKAGPQHALIVRDSGRGLDANQQRLAFEPFHRLGAEYQGIEGTGLGLALVRQLCEQMGGSVELDSQPGVGSEFRCWLPAAADQG